MSLGEVRQVSEDIYAYLQPDGSWYLNNTGFLVSDAGVISIDATSTERRTRAYLDAIGHPTARRIGKRPPSPTWATCPTASAWPSGAGSPRTT
jgi:hypothetical protein